MTVRQPCWWLPYPTCLLIALGWGTAASAQTTDESLRVELGAIRDSVERLIRDDPKKLTVVPTSGPGSSFAQGLAEAHLSLARGDVQGARGQLSILLTAYPDHPYVAEARYWLGVARMRGGDYIGARSEFRLSLDDPRWGKTKSHRARVMSKLVEVGIKLRDLSGLERFLDVDDASAQDPTWTYVKGKVHYARATGGLDTKDRPMAGSGRIAELERAAAAFNSVPQTTELYAHAQYFLGVVHIQRGQLLEAQQAFSRAVNAKNGDARVRELSILALGRTSYELGDTKTAVDAYQLISKNSARRDEALYEMAWAQIRGGLYPEAEGTLSRFAGEFPNSPRIPDVKLLRANLLLRTGRREQASGMFEEVAADYRSVYQELRAMAASDADLRTYIDAEIAKSEGVLDVQDILPERARKLMLTGTTLGEASALAKQVDGTEALVTEYEQLIERMISLLDDVEAMYIFPETRNSARAVTALHNRLTNFRMRLIDSQPGGKGLGQRYASVRNERRGLNRSISSLPTSGAALIREQLQTAKRYDNLGEALITVEGEIKELDNVLNALERASEQSKADAAAAGSTATLSSAVDAERRRVEMLREGVKGLRDYIEQLRVKAALGGEQASKYAQLRTRYEDLAKEEEDILKSAGLKKHGEFERLYERSMAVEARLDEYEARLSSNAQARAAALRQELADERERIGAVNVALDDLRGRSKNLVSDIAIASIQDATQRFYSLAMRADLGKLDVAWSKREDHRKRVELLNRDRTRTLKALDEEYGMAVDDGQSSAN